MSMSSEEIAQVMERPDDWQTAYGLKNWYLGNKDGYVCIHIYFKNEATFTASGISNFVIPKTWTVASPAT